MTTKNETLASTAKAILAAATPAQRKAVEVHVDWALDALEREDWAAAVEGAYLACIQCGEATPDWAAEAVWKEATALDLA